MTDVRAPTLGQIIDGKAIAARVRAEVALRAAKLRGTFRAPALAVVLVGDDPASAIYVRNKDRAAREAGLEVSTHHLPATSSEADVLALVKRLSVDASIDGILVQLPLPTQISAARVISAIDPGKDVDGLHPTNVGLVASGRGGFVPCTPAGVMRMLAEENVKLEGTRAVVIGRSQLVGKPLIQLLLGENATVVSCHSRTRDLRGEVLRGQVVISAMGRAEMVRGDWIAEGATVIDVGMNRRADGSLCGDVAYEEARTRAARITPVPGGVGPMTIALLLSNTVTSAESRSQ